MAILTCPFIVDVDASIVCKNEVISVPLSSVSSINEAVALNWEPEFKLINPCPLSWSTIDDVKVKSNVAPPNEPSAPEEPDVPSVPDVPLEPLVPEVPEVSDVFEVPEVFEVFDVFQMSEVFDVFEVPEFF